MYEFVLLMLKKQRMLIEITNKMVKVYNVQLYPFDHIGS